MRVRISTAVLLLAFASMAAAQQANPARDAVREKLGQLLETAGKLPDVKTTFGRGEKEPYNFVASVTDNLTHASTLEIVIRVTPNDTIGFRVYPHYKGEYINVDKVKDRAGLMRAMLLYSDRNFLFWGIDEAGDVFSGCTITLESGFPSEAVETVVRSLRNTGPFVGHLRPFIDGTGKKQ